MTNEKLSVLLQGLTNVSDLKGVKFAYAMSKNRKKIETELETLREAVKPKDKFQEYDKKRVEMCEQHADKDDKDKPKLENNEYVFSKENKKKFDKDVEKLKKEYQKETDEREKQIKEFQELLKKESDFKPYMVAYEDIPEDITSANLDGIIDLVSEPIKK